MVLKIESLLFFSKDNLLVTNIHQGMSKNTCAEVDPKLKIVKSYHVFVYGLCLHKCLMERDQETLGYHQVYILFVAIL